MLSKILQIQSLLSNKYTSILVHSLLSCLIWSKILQIQSLLWHKYTSILVHSLLSFLMLSKIPRIQSLLSHKYTSILVHSLLSFLMLSKIPRIQSHLSHKYTFLSVYYKKNALITNLCEDTMWRYKCNKCVNMSTHLGKAHIKGPKGERVWYVFLK